MDKFFKNIDKQIAFNQGKNFFFDKEAKALKFLADTINAIDDLNDTGSDFENYYSPDLPFIEQYLDNDQFGMLKYGNGEYDFKTTSIRRLK